MKPPTKLLHLEQLTGSGIISDENVKAGFIDRKQLKIVLGVDLLRS